MAIILGDLIASARGITQDERPPFRVSNAALAGYVAEAVGEARRVRPDLFLTVLRAPIVRYTGLDLTLSVPLPDYYFNQIVNYVAGRADLREDEFAQDGRAVTLLTAWGVALTGGARA